MDRLTEILQTLQTQYGVEFGCDEQSDKLEQSKRNCEWLCEKENERPGTLNKGDGFDCPICKNKGHIYVPQLCHNIYNIAQAPCKCVTIRKTIWALKRSGLEYVVRDFTFDKYIATEQWQKNALETAKHYLKNEGKEWFFFGGATGSGKSHLCTAIAISLLKRGNEVKYMLWRDEASRLKAIVNEPEYDKEIKPYKEVDVLYIDDLFKTGKSESNRKQRPTTGDINLAFEILNSRSYQDKITIISSESTLTDLIDIDEAIAGRIKHKCGEYCLNIAPDISKNYRLK